MSSKRKLLVAFSAWLTLVASAQVVQTNGWRRVPNIVTNGWRFEPMLTTNRWRSIEQRQRKLPEMIYVTLKNGHAYLAWKATMRSNLVSFTVERRSLSLTNEVTLAPEAGGWAHGNGEHFTTYYWRDPVPQDGNPISYRVRMNFPLWQSGWTEAMQATAPVGATP